MHRSKIGMAVLTGAILAGCGGSNEMARGGVRSSETLTLMSKAAIDTASAARPGLQQLAGSAKCDVTVVALDYMTIGAAASERSNASGVLLLPSGAGCNGPYPLLGYARGTDALKARTMANPADPETVLLAAFYAAQGYAVVATDYLAYAKSDYPYHPYLHADSEASTVIDSLRAARNVARTMGVALSGKVMLTGYSQGGHAGMSAHRAIERDNASEFNLVAAGHMSGPYALSESMLDGIDTPPAGATIINTFAFPGWQKTYKDVYANVTDVFKLPYATGIESLVPGPLSFAQLVDPVTGKIPASRDALMQPAFLADFKANPNNGARRAAVRNDLLAWTPKAATVLCGGKNDPTVPFKNALTAQAAFASRGVTVSVVDVDPIIQLQQPVNIALYHGVSVPPLCMKAVRDNLFNGLK